MKDSFVGDSDALMVRSDSVVMDDSEETSEGFEHSEEQEPGEESGYFELSENEIVLKFSVTLMNRLRRSAYDEGIELDELAAELITEGLTQRATQDAQRGAPSHLMTRTGYVPPDANGNVAQPFLSHHQNGNGQGRGPRRPNNQGQRRNHQRGNRSGNVGGRPGPHGGNVGGRRGR